MVEGKNNVAVITYQFEPKPYIRWLNLHLSILLDQKSTYQKEALSNRAKYVRVIKRSFRQKERFHVQLVLEGIPPKRHALRLGKGTVGLDVGPSKVAVVTDATAELVEIAPTIADMEKESHRLQRGMDRSRRATNPDNYNKDKTVKKGSKKWLRSSHYVKLAKQKRDLERRKKAERKRSNGQLANEIVRSADTGKAENLSYRSFQKNYGKSVGNRAPGGLMHDVENKFKRLNGRWVSINTRTTRLSQYDHTTNDFVKKPLSQRIHVLRDGSGSVQRDICIAHGWHAIAMKISSTQKGFMKPGRVWNHS